MIADTPKPFRIRPTYYADSFAGFHIEAFNTLKDDYEPIGVNHTTYVKAMLSLRALETGKEPVRGVVTDECIIARPYVELRRTWSKRLTVHGCIIMLIGVAMWMSGCSTMGANWNEGNTAAELAYQGINAIDALQTDRIRSRADLVEGGVVARQFMGREPSRSSVALYFGSLAVSHALISFALPERLRPWWQGGTIVTQGYSVMQNCTEHQLLCN